MKGDSEEWRSGWGGLIGWGDGWVLAERCSYARVYARSRTRSFVFLLSQVSQRMGLKILHHPKNDVSFYRKQRVVLLKTTYRFTENNVSFYWKQRVVLLKTTCRFTENIVSFYGKQRVVLDWRTKSCFEDGILRIFGGGVAAWKCDSVGCCFWNQCKWLLHNGLYRLCDTCDSKKHKTPVMRIRARVSRDVILPPPVLGHCTPSSF